MKVLMEIKNLTLELGGKKILNGLSMELWESHVHAIIGTNGAGKSTLANTIMGLSGYREFEGEIFFRGESLRGKDINDRAGMGITLGWQEPARYEGLKVIDFVLAPLVDKDPGAAEKALLTVGLKPDEYLYRAIDKTLSGGERKKVELASILAMKPKLAFLDEPDSGIDIESIERIFSTVKILKEHGTTVVFITHSLAVLKQADHAFLLCGGRIVDKGSTKHIRRYFEKECLPCECRDPDVRRSKNEAN